MANTTLEAVLRFQHGQVTAPYQPVVLAASGAQEKNKSEEERKKEQKEDNAEKH